jgi:Zn-dependent protease
MDFALLLTAYVVFVYSTVCHEAAHAWVAHKLGDNTAYLGGQVTLDPIPHIRREPIGMLFVPLFMLFTSGRLIGWASAPLDPMWVARYPKRSALVAIAGPAANFILCVVAAVAIFIGAKNGVFTHSVRPYFQDFVSGTPGTVWETIAQILGILFSLNLLLGVLNLMPVPPLDGSNLPLLFLGERAADRYQQAIRQPWMILITLVLIFKVFPLVYWPISDRVTIWIYLWCF